ncbi:hypothetical protein Nepgr_026328 [Nepenthes gracilis]|uniref:Erythromycin biosynthesis protein CIII-like C-terminal domain-containing protein n=1 Tax=Nepenthes gracilis TaxID=150966 RepID=A0AAD3T6R3_NEPGR|nr:hypothetical protein Nepgr_026328 [Nepenthes gracilis]
MAFGTNGDVYPIAAIAAAFACDQRRYEVVFVTHSAHENLAARLTEKDIEYALVSSPPVLSPTENDDTKGSCASSFSMRKSIITKEHRRECFLVMERFFGVGRPSKEGDFVVINFFALEGWNLAELFCIRCVVAAPYVVPYSAPSSFERQFRQELPLLYKYFKEAPVSKICWNDVIHWMWPLFTEDWGSWRDELKLSRWPFTDPVTGLPMWHERPISPLLLYGFSREVVECPDYWPSNARVCGFWFLPQEWQFSCNSCKNNFDSLPFEWQETKGELCLVHTGIHSFLKFCKSMPLVFVGLSSIGSMGFLRNPWAFLHILRAVVDITKYRFILFSSGCELLESAIRVIATEEYSSLDQQEISKDGHTLFCGRLFCFFGSIPYIWLFRQCAAAIHHGGSGSTAAALHAGIPQVLCPFILDQFYWAERMFWLGVAPEPLKRNHLLPEQIRARAQEISERISLEDGVHEAVRILREEMGCPATSEN